jgi:HK97 family phage major capsid protein
MFKYKLVDGKKFLVDLKGLFIKNEEGENVEAPEGTEEFNEADQAATDAVENGTATDAPEDGSVEDMKSYLASKSSAQIKELLGGLDLKGLFAVESRKALVDMIKGSAPAKDKSIDVEAVKKGFAHAKGAAGRSYEVKVKELSELNSLTGEVIEEDRRPGITRDPVETPFIEELATTGTTGSNKVTWVEVGTESGGPATTAELAKFPEKNYTFLVQSADVYKIAVMSKASNEILEDAPQLVSFVRNALVEDLRIKFDNELLTGNGTGTFTGILTTAPAFTGGGLAGTFDAGTVTRFDVLRAVINEIKANGKGGFMPTAICLHPDDATKLDLEKGSDGHYIMPPFSTADRTTIKGVRIVENTQITSGSFLVGDFRKMVVANRRGLALQVATENVDDFEKDMISMRLSRRAASYVRTNDIGAFSRGTFAAAITALET